MKQRITHYILIGLIACGFFGVPDVSVAGKWEPKAPLLRKRWGLGTETVNGKIYAIGGQDDLPDAGKKVAEYDPDRDQWTEKKGLPTGRFRLATGMVRGKIYVFGGTTNNFEAVPTVEEYDPKTDMWTKKADMPTARLGLAAAVVGGKIYTIGGAESFFFPSGAVEVYDPCNRYVGKERRICPIRDGVYPPSRLPPRFMFPAERLITAIRNIPIRWRCTTPKDGHMDEEIGYANRLL